MIVVRSLAIKGGANGLLHRITNKRDVDQSTKVVSFQPKVTVPRGDETYMETILPLPQERNDYAEVPVRRQREILEPIHHASPAGIRFPGLTRVRRYEEVGRENAPPTFPVSLLWDEPYTMVTGFKDQISGIHDTWRLNFIFNKQPVEAVVNTAVMDWTKALLTIQDETNSVMLFTLVLDREAYQPKPGLFKIETPLRRFLRQANTETGPTLWDSLTEDEDP